MWRITLARKAIASAQRALDNAKPEHASRCLAFARALLRGDDVDDYEAGRLDGRVNSDRVRRMEQQEPTNAAELRKLYGMESEEACRETRQQVTRRGIAESMARGAEYDRKVSE